MGKLKIYDPAIPRENILREREMAYGLLSTKDKLARLFSLITLSVILNKGKPIKNPQGKGIIIFRKGA